MAETILVTGATAGFGAAFTRRFVREGHRVIATGRRRERLEALRAELGAAVLPYALDVTDRAAVARLPEALPAEWQEVSVLVNNAGLALGAAPSYESSVDDWDRMVATNVTGLMHMTRMFLPGMVARDRGTIINIGSTAGSYAYPGGMSIAPARHSFAIFLWRCAPIWWGGISASRISNPAWLAAANSAPSASRAMRNVRQGSTTT